MKVDQKKVVALSYELTVEGALADKATAEKPLEYIHGTGMLLPRFEEEVAGKEVGESFESALRRVMVYTVQTTSSSFLRVLSRWTDRFAKTFW